MRIAYAISGFSTGYDDTISDIIATAECFIRDNCSEVMAEMELQELYSEWHMVSNMYGVNGYDLAYDVKEMLNENGIY